LLNSSSAQPALLVRPQAKPVVVRMGAPNPTRAKD
jgi:hypothetical protein